MGYRHPPQLAGKSVMKPILQPNTYRERRQRLAQDLGTGVFILASAPARTRSNDTEYKYRASSDIAYLTGFTEPDTVMVMVIGETAKFTMFVRERDPAREIWDGRRSGTAGVVEHFGADEAHPIGQLAKELPALLESQERVFYTLNQRPSIDRQFFAALRELRGGRGKPERAPETITDPRRVLHDLRRLKDANELALLREAVDIAADAHIEAMRTVRPGQMEYEVAARLDFAFRRRGAVGPGYETIVGGGANATILHYIENSAELLDGTLVLIDAGCEYNYYNSDITRTFPVGSEFTGAQRDVYQAVLDVQKEAIDKVRPGASAHGLTTWSKRALTEKLVDLGLLSGDLDNLVETRAYDRFYMHNLGHYLGIDVHDVGTYLIDEDNPLPFEPGVVFTVEPGLYIPCDDDIPEAMRGIGIRIEDDVLVTSDEAEVISHRVPKEVAEIEALRREALR